MNTRKVGRSRGIEISFHADQGEAHPAINVEYQSFPSELVNASEATREFAWDATVLQFWDAAQDIAHEHDYSGVFSEGRSSGWLVPFSQYVNDKLQKFTQWPGQGPNLGYPRYPDVTDAKERKRFVRFQKDILELLASVPDMIRENAKEYTPRIRCNQCEACMINGLFCHETGCPNSRSRYDADSDTWIKQRECFECGFTVDADDPCCNGEFNDD